MAVGQVGRAEASTPLETLAGGRLRRDLPKPPAGPAVTTLCAALVRGHILLLIDKFLLSG